MRITVHVEKFEITPEHQTSLLGYFNNRISTGVIDPLFCRLLAARNGRTGLLLIQIDSCLIPTADAERLRDEIAGTTEFKPREVLICTNHTHTAPALTDFYGVKAEKHYARKLYDIILKKARSLEPKILCTVKRADTAARGISHNRRWLMKDGTLITNPPKGSDDRERPEGKVDDGVAIIGFYDKNSTPVALMVSISNHTDTIGGTRISADWTGCMERTINEKMKRRVPVITLIAPQGNINHYDFDSAQNQTSPEEANRIGREYANVVLSGLQKSLPVVVNRFNSLIRYVDIKPREVDAESLQNAREIFENSGVSIEETDLKAEDLETPTVRKLFARELVNFHESKPQSYSVPLQALRMGDIFLCAIPGEPFVEIGLELKDAVGSGMVVPVALANGYFGYIPLEGCFDRGGYEVQPGKNNCLTRRAAEIITEELKQMMLELL